MSRPEHSRTYSTNLVSGGSGARALEGRTGIVTGASRGMLAMVVHVGHFSPLSQASVLPLHAISPAKA